MGKKEKITGIYMITNPVGQMYIGQARDIHNRFRLYKYGINAGGGIRDSVSQYGHKNHTLTILEQCDMDKLNEREDYYIRLYDTRNTDHGLNRLPGGMCANNGTTLAGETNRELRTFKKFDKEEFAKLRKSKNVSIYKLSVLSKTPTWYIEKYESGITKPSFRVYNKMISAINSIEPKTTTKCQ